MKKIVIYQFKFDRRKTNKKEIQEIGYIIPHKDGFFEIHGSSKEIKVLIEGALNKVLKKGVSKQWSKIKKFRIIEYARILKPGDAEFVEFLSEQLFDKKKKLGRYTIAADTEDRFKKLEAS